MCIYNIVDIGELQSIVWLDLDGSWSAGWFAGMLLCFFGAWQGDEKFLPGPEELLWQIWQRTAMPSEISDGLRTTMTKCWYINSRPQSRWDGNLGILFEEGQTKKKLRSKCSKFKIREVVTATFFEGRTWRCKNCCGSFSVSSSPAVVHSRATRFVKAGQRPPRTRS